MSLRLEQVSKLVDGAIHIYPTDLEFETGSMNVLLGPTLSGKTSLMRLMAGLDRPHSGKVFWRGEDVTDRRVQDRDIAMVYQQFVNYPSMTVYDNIASPMRLQGMSARAIEQRVEEVAELLQLTTLLDRKPDQISGGQQQRCAMARALAKNAGLVLMDEPLANLDYKLREELRVEIPRIFETSGSVFVYATTEPEEALLLGGNTVTLSEGRVTQFGPAAEVYRQPVNVTTASIYSDPPLNILSVRKTGATIDFPDGQTIALPDDMVRSTDGDYQAGFRAHHLSIGSVPEGAIALDARLTVSEMSGSDTYVHFEAMGQQLTAMVAGLHDYETGTRLDVGLPTEHVHLFGRDGVRIGSLGGLVAGAAG